LFNGDSEELFSKLFLGFGSPWGFASEHFKEDDSQSPNITFETVLIVIECLRWHVDWASNVIGGVLFGV
jgi:hypothetical protein